ncbi:hypothetical protein, partial [Klebsiella variicola]|uniref:hypothetical protein n=3 Tax=Klebsiella pneumoniae complex TaxID=3390273 RepID=UPI001C45A7FF
RNRSHWSTSKTPSYTKSVSWQHHRRSKGDNGTGRKKKIPALKTIKPWQMPGPGVLNRANTSILLTLPALISGTHYLLWR